VKARDLTLFAAGLALCLAAPAAASAPQKAPEPGVPAIAEACRKDLALRLKVDPGLVELKSSAEVVWPDAALGLRRPGEMAAQVLTPGHSLILEVKPQGREYLYTAGGKSFRYGGPLELWANSALTVEGGESDPNFNGRLVQLSLIGTNREVLLEGVGDFYPQPDGSLFAKRRTSRSGHKLLYAAPGKTVDAAVVAAAFDFTDAVVSPDGRRGAVLARTGPELAWELVIVSLASAPSEPRRVGLPEGLRPERLRWRRDGDPDDVSTGDGHPLVLMGSLDGKPARYGLADLDGAPSWESLPAYVASEHWDFVLSKSHSLGVGEIEMDGKPAVRLEYIWWNRGPEEIATIPGLKLDGYRWARGHEFVFIAGHGEDGHAGLVVDIRTGEVLTAVSGARNPVRLFSMPPYDWLRIKSVTRQSLR
jgi:hypothetical protein